MRKSKVQEKISQDRVKDVKIGVLGGLGPESSVDFYARMIREVQSRGMIRANQDYPHLVINSIPAEPVVVHNPDLSMYVAGLRDLDKVGCSFIVIVCNTAHAYLDELSKYVSIPLLDIEKEVHVRLLKKKVKSFIVLGSMKTERLLFNYEDIRKVALSKRDAQEIDDIILVYNNGAYSPSMGSTLRKISRKYPVDEVLIACTELSCIARKSSFKGMDTMDVMVDATINAWRSLRKS